MLEGPTICPKCNHENPSSSIFCGQCGSKLYKEVNNLVRPNKKKIYWVSSLIILSVIVAVAFILIPKSIEHSTSIHQEGKTFKTVKIGDQEWMAENLNIDHYQNGDPISEIKDSVEWASLKTGAWCYY